MDVSLILCVFGLGGFTYFIVWPFQIFINQCVFVFLYCTV